MAQRVIFAFPHLIAIALAYVVPSPTPTATPLVRRDEVGDQNDAAIRTFTFGPMADYIAINVSNVMILVWLKPLSNTHL